MMRFAIAKPKFEARNMYGVRWKKWNDVENIPFSLDNRWFKTVKCLRSFSLFSNVCGNRKLISRSTTSKFCHIHMDRERERDRDAHVHAYLTMELRNFKIDLNGKSFRDECVYVIWSPEHTVKCTTILNHYQRCMHCIFHVVTEYAWGRQSSRLSDFVYWTFFLVRKCVPSCMWRRFYHFRTHTHAHKLKCCVESFWQ